MLDGTVLNGTGPTGGTGLADCSVTVTTGKGQWHARLAGSAPLSRDALVAGFVPGVALGWSWPDSLRHAVSLAASAGPAGEVDLVSYERLLPRVTVEVQRARPGSR